MVSARIPTDEAEFQLYLYHNNHDDKEHLAVVLGDVRGKPDVLVRLHSECFTGDVLGSRRCDCGEQLHFAMQQIAAHGEGVLVYLRQEAAALACWISCALTTCKMRAMTPSKLTCSSAIRPMSAITP
jgi:3,4-dihydroxy 2-butanone 4-phosphate synthase/GTP cyclohydrolase II